MSTLDDEERRRPQDDHVSVVASVLAFLDRLFERGVQTWGATLRTLVLVVGLAAVVFAVAWAMSGASWWVAAGLGGGAGAGSLVATLRKKPSRAASTRPRRRR